MEWLIFALAACAIVGIALYMGRRRTDGFDPLRGGGTRFADLDQASARHRRPGVDSQRGGGTR